MPFLSPCTTALTTSPPTNPQTPMKRSPLPIIAGAIALLLIPPFATDLFANRTTLQPQSLSDSKQSSEYPLGRDCIITLDSEFSKPVFAGRANIDSGFAAPDTVKGTIIEEKDFWLILKCGRNENWIPKSKILMISVQK